MSGFNRQYVRKVDSAMSDLNTALLSFTKEASKWDDARAMESMEDEVANFGLFLESFVARMRARASRIRDDSPKGD